MLLSLKLMIESELLRMRILLVNVAQKSEVEVVTVNTVLKNNPWTYKIKDLNRENVIGSFYEKELLLSKL